MTYLASLAVVEGLVILAGLFWAYYVLDQLDSERRRCRNWQSECELWAEKARTGRLWHLYQSETKGASRDQRPA